VSQQRSAFHDDYRDAFRSYLETGEEQALSAAYELGRRAMETRLSVLDVADIHHQVLFEWLTTAPPSRVGWAGKAAGRFVLELLSTYEMVARGFVEVQEMARLEQAHAAQLRLLADASVAINAAGSIREIVVAITEHALDVIDAERSSATVVPARAEQIAHAVGEPGAGDTATTLTASLVRRDRSPLGTIEVSRSNGRSFSSNDEAILTQLAQLGGVALENAELLDQQRLVAETLQRRLLPGHLPEVAGLQMAKRYVPAWTGSEIGGDWYDAMLLPDGQVGFVVGDVMGKGIRAAAGMGQLRIAVRAYAIEGHAPGVVVARLDQMLTEIGEDFATAVYLRHDPGSGALRMSNAGHPPPVLISPDGSARLLRGGLCPPLGCIGADECDEDEVPIPAGATLVVYTDGLIEERGTDIDEGLDRLLDVCTGEVGELEGFCDRVLRVLGAEHRGDDVALLAVRFGEQRL
jgi:GAF domain-containing protein